MTLIKWSSVQPNLASLWRQLRSRWSLTLHCLALMVFSAIVYKVFPLVLIPENRLCIYLIYWPCILRIFHFVWLPWTWRVLPFTSDLYTLSVNSSPFIRSTYSNHFKKFRSTFTLLSWHTFELLYLHNLHTPHIIRKRFNYITSSLCFSYILKLNFSVPNVTVETTTLSHVPISAPKLTLLTLNPIC